MSPLLWSQACTVGIRAMDDQHGVLLDALNELRLALARGGDWDAVQQLQGRLIRLTRQHFESEERLLLRYEFPGLKDHRAEHQRLLGLLEQYATRLDRHVTGSMRDACEFLRDWFTTHIENVDRLYGPWLRERGVR